MSMTIEIPDAVVEQLRAEAEARGEDLNNYAVAKLQKPADEESDDDLIEALRQGIADRDAGRTVTLEEMDARIYAILTPESKTD